MVMPTFYIDPLAPDAGDMMDGGGFLPQIANPGELPYGYGPGETNSSTSSTSGFGDFLRLGGMFSNAFGNDPLRVSQDAGNQLAYNLGQSAGTAAIAAQGLGIKGQLLGAGTAFLGEDAQLNRETNAILRGQQLNQTNLARERNAQQFKVAMAGRMNTMAIERASAMAYGV